MKLGRTLKKAVAIGAMAAMAAVMSLPVYATDITVSNAVDEKTYYAYKIFDATVADDKIAYTLDTTTENGAAIYDALKDAGVFTFTSIGAGKYTVALADNKTDEDVAKAVKGNFTVGADGKITGLTAPTGVAATDKTATLSVSNSGYYFVTTTNGTVVTVDTVKDSTITVIDKNKTPGWETDPDDGNDSTGKTVSNDGQNGTYKKANSVSIGSDSYFKINAYVPTVSNGDKVDSYAITDTLGDGFTLDGDVTVKFTDDDGKEIDALKNLATADTNTANKIIVTFTIRDGTTHEVIANYPTETHVEITYKAKVDADAVHDNKNTVKMTYTVGDSGTEEKTDIPDSETDTYVYGFNVDKYDANKQTTKLAGAEFELYTAETGGEKISVAKDNDGVYKVSKEGTATITTDSNGAAKIFGLAEGTYYLEETKAPLGYNKLTARQKVTVLEGDSDGSTKIDTVTADGYANASVEVANSAGSVLPSTGGAGRIAIYAVGGVLVVGFGIVMVSKKRSGEE